MAWQNNTAELRGLMGGEPRLSHISKGVSYYGFEVVTKRLSGAVDRVNVTAPEHLMDAVPAAGALLGGMDLPQRPLPSLQALETLVAVLRQGAQKRQHFCAARFAGSLSGSRWVE